MSDEAGAEYSTAHGLMRGLAVLQALQRESNATATVVALAAATGLHRTTVKRLLETLRQAGYVRFLAADNSYRLTFRVQQLAEGFRDEVWVSDVASPLLHELTGRILWPSSVVTLERDTLVVRASTHRSSPLSFHKGALGATLPLLRTAAGRAWLAFCPDEERELLLELAHARGGGEGKLASDRGRLDALLRAARTRGFAINEGDWIGHGRYGAIAAPTPDEAPILVPSGNTRPVSTGW